jgi:hypothetical protein
VPASRSYAALIRCCSACGVTHLPKCVSQTAPRIALVVGKLQVRLQVTDHACPIRSFLELRSQSEMRTRILRVALQHLLQSNQAVSRHQATCLLRTVCTFPSDALLQRVRALSDR